jgi:hypothetical protein
MLPCDEEVTKHMDVAFCNATAPAAALVLHLASRDDPISMGLSSLLLFVCATHGANTLPTNKCTTCQHTPQSILSCASDGPAFGDICGHLLTNILAWS